MSRWARLDDLLLAKAAELKKAGRRPFVWDRITGRPHRGGQLRAVPGGDSRASTRAQGFEPTHVYAAAAGATGGRVCASARPCSAGRAQFACLCPIRWPWDTPADLAEVANADRRACSACRTASPPTDIDIRTDYIGDGYGTDHRRRPRSHETARPAPKASCSTRSTPPRRWPASSTISRTNV